jgi:hypothetical protein
MQAFNMCVFKEYLTTQGKVHVKMSMVLQIPHSMQEIERKHILATTASWILHKSTMFLSKSKNCDQKKI